MFEDGWATYLWFLVLVNVFIGVFNLVPLLPLDGGHVAIATYERLRSFGGRRHVADAAKLVPVTWAVVSLLVLVAAVALYRDIVDLPDFG
jgi:membrane-associated protease RseP (regulator of RpoE activity)